MKSVLSASIALGVFMAGTGLVLAQNADRDAFRAQENNAGWGLAQPEPAEVPVVEEQEPEEDLSNEPVMVGDQQFGWLVAPSVPVSDENISELERLSVSPSGVRFGGQLYDAKSDNPLEPVSVTIRALDKITAQYTDLTIDIDASSDFGILSITARTCDKRPPEEFPETTAFLEILSTEEDDRIFLDSPPPPGLTVDTAAMDEIRAEEDTLPPGAVFAEATDDGESQPEEAELPEGTLFSGWMFASSPALNALQHPVYDVWVIDCKMVEPSI